MRTPTIKRFYAHAEVAEEGSGWALRLDGRGARTPAKRPLVAPSRAVAQLIAREWSEQKETLSPADMPITRLANSAIDGVAEATQPVVDEIVRYAGADLVCYRAEEPYNLVMEQAEAFDPVLAWAEQQLGARFILSAGIRHVQQPTRSLEAVRRAVEARNDPFALAALHVQTALTGSALIALQVAAGAVAPDLAWRAAHVDEDFQIRQWGEDEEANLRRAARWRDFEAAAKVLDALRSA